jgi:hypothetical protein
MLPPPGSMAAALQKLNASALRYNLRARQY